MIRRLALSAGAMLLLVAAAKAAVVYPTLGYTSNGSATTKIVGLRMIDSTGALLNNWYTGGSASSHLLPVPVGLYAKYRGTGTWVPSTFTLTSSTNGSGALVSLSSASGTVTLSGTNAVPTPSSFNYGFAQLGTDGPVTAIITGSVSTTASPITSGLTVMGVVLQNRQMTVDTIGTTSAPVRIMANTPVYSYIRTGTGTINTDNYATRLNAVNGTASNSNVDVRYVPYQLNGPSRLQYNGPSQNNKIYLTSSSSSGIYQGSIDVSPSLLSNGETAMVGATVLSATMNYSIDVLEQRNLVADGSGVASLNVLRGVSQVSGVWELDSTNANPDSTHCTSVYINKRASQTVASVNGDKFTLPAYSVAVTNGNPVLLPYYSTLLKSNTAYQTVTVGGSGVIGVTTAEAASVGDTNPYANIPFTIQMNVGQAYLNGSGPLVGDGTSSYANVSGIFSATVTSGHTLVTMGNSATYLSSMVWGTGTLTSVTATSGAIHGIADLPGWDGPIGSEAVIMASNAVSGTTSITMQWRSRTGAEAHSLAVPTPAGSPVLADDVMGLVSDVVQVNVGTSGGLFAMNSGTIYAMQISFDERIMLALNGTRGSLATMFNDNDLYPVAVDPSTNTWTKATLLTSSGTHAQVKVWDSLADFLYQNITVHHYSLDSLLGSWGVDGSGASSTGLAHAWVITRGSGTFAVVPEPSTIVMLISAAGIGVASVWRMRRPKKRIKKLGH